MAAVSTARRAASRSGTIQRWVIGIRRRPSATIAGVLLLLILIVLVRHFGCRPRLRWTELPTTGPAGTVVAIGKGRIFWWDGRVFRWATSARDEPLQSFEFSSVRSISDFASGKKIPVTGLQVTAIETVCASPNAARLAICGAVSGGSGVSYNLLILDVESGQAWGLFPSILKRGVRWASDQQVVMTSENAKYSAYNLDILKKTTHETEGQAGLRFAGIREGEVVALGNADSGFRSVIKITEYHSAEASRTVRMWFPFRKVAMGQACVDPSRDLWMVGVKERATDSEILFAVDPRWGGRRKLAELPFRHWGSMVFPTLRTIGNKDYLLVTHGIPLEPRLFELD